MGTQLNIKSPEARELAEKVARASGESITQAVTRALRDRWRALQRQSVDTEGAHRRREREFYDMIQGSRMRWKGAMLSIDHADILYDDHGLPR